MGFVVGEATTPTVPFLLELAGALHVPVPLLVSIMMPTMISCCCQDRSMPMAWARKREPIVR
ncbi:hypothetical protein [Streptomyces sp. NPDC001652]|uniref:hypothetical protein n=1 Tax=Streptomyces sp. NPDC001652 TaxID=3154393 RepID=UPI00332632B5